MILLRIFPICVPLTGAVLNPLTALLIVLCALLFKSSTALYSVTLGIPTIIATLCWISETQTTRIAQIVNVILPIACMIAFCWHPVGQQAFAYSLYWLIPPALFANKNLFRVFAKGARRSYILNSLSPAIRITFITHAVGSILWLYTVPTTSTYWIALIPVVAFERLYLAGATTGVLFVIKIFERIFVKITAKA